MSQQRVCDPCKIMVRATNWVGDAIMSLPAIESVRVRFPEAELVVVAKPWVSELYANHPAVSRRIVYDPARKRGGAGGFRQFVRALEEEQFDCAILLPNSFHAAWMAWRARIPVRVGYARAGRSLLLTDAVEPPSPACYGHQVQYYLELLFRSSLIARPERPPLPRLFLDKDEIQWAARELELYGLGGQRFLVGLNPGASYGPAKRWLPERFAAVADRLIEALHADVLLFGSAAERPLAETVAHDMDHTPTIVAGRTTLRQWMALMARCRLVVTNDSGATHVAAALGVPVVVVFGSTDEHSTGPLGKQARVVKRTVACSPCLLRGCPIDFRCMNAVTVDDVYQTALRLVVEAAG